MDNNKLSSFTLALSAILILGGLAGVSQPDLGFSFEASVVLFLGGLVLAFATWRLRVSVRKQEEAQRARLEEQKKEAAEQERQRREALEEERKRQRDQFRYERFAVAGVTFKNDDGSDRQKILREIALNDFGVCDVDFEENEELGEDSGISVMTEYGCVGFIRRSDKAKVRRFFGRQTQSYHLAVDRFEADDGQKIYRADVCITMKRGDPEQQWYFDELSEV